MERVFFDYGVEICREKGQFYMIFDNGRMASRLETVEISEGHANCAMKGPKEAGEIILHYLRIEDRKRKLGMSRTERYDRGRFCVLRARHEPPPHQTAKPTPKKRKGKN